MPKQKQTSSSHDHAGGSGAVLGVRVMRYSGVQAIALVVSNLIQLVSVMVVAAFLGPSEMARYALLLFLAGLVCQMLSLLVKPGTIRRVFGGGDDEDDDDEDDEVVSRLTAAHARHRARLGGVLGVIGDRADRALPRADRRRACSATPRTTSLVAWAGVLAGVWLVFKIADITLWLERRPSAFVVADTRGPCWAWSPCTALLAGGTGVEGAIVGTAIGTAIAAIVGVVLLCAGASSPPSTSPRSSRSSSAAATGRRS